MVSYAIVGASRGIGLEFVRQLAKKPDATVFALVRNARASSHLHEAIAGMKNVHVIEADVAEHTTLEAAAQAVSKTTGGKLDCLVYNAARTDQTKMLLGFDSFASMADLDAEFLTSFKINTLGLIHSVAAFLPLLRASTIQMKKILVLGTSGADPKTVVAVGSPNVAAYCTTKAAELMVATKYSALLKNEGFVVATVNPGMVDTSETVDQSALDQATRDIFARFREANKAKLQTPAQSVEALLKVMDGLKPSDNGLFLNTTGEEYTVPVIVRPQ